MTVAALHRRLLGAFPCSLAEPLTAPFDELRLDNGRLPTVQLVFCKCKTSQLKNCNVQTMKARNVTDCIRWASMYVSTKMATLKFARKGRWLRELNTGNTADDTNDVRVTIQQAILCATYRFNGDALQSQMQSQVAT
jgi:hypothetical protein